MPLLHLPYRRIGANSSCSRSPKTCVSSSYLRLVVELLEVDVFSVRAGFRTRVEDFPGLVQDVGRTVGRLHAPGLVADVLISALYMRREVHSFPRAKAELARRPETPSEYFACGSLADRVLVAAADLRDLLAHIAQLLDQMEPIPVLGVAHAQLSVLVAARAEQKAVVGERDREVVATRYLAELGCGVEHFGGTGQELVRVCLVGPSVYRPTFGDNVVFFPLGSDLFDGFSE